MNSSNLSVDCVNVRINSSADFVFADLKTRNAVNDPVNFRIGNSVNL